MLPPSCRHGSLVPSGAVHWRRPRARLRQRTARGEPRPGILRLVSSRERLRRLPPGVAKPMDFHGGDYVLNHAVEARRTTGLLDLPSQQTFCSGCHTAPWVGSRASPTSTRTIRCAPSTPTAGCRLSGGANRHAREARRQPRRLRELPPRGRLLRPVPHRRAGSPRACNPHGVAGATAPGARRSRARTPMGLRCHIDSSRSAAIDRSGRVEARKVPPQPDLFFADSATRRCARSPALCRNLGDGALGSRSRIRWTRWRPPAALSAPAVRTLEARRRGAAPRIAAHARRPFGVVMAARNAEHDRGGIGRCSPEPTRRPS